MGAMGQSSLLELFQESLRRGGVFRLRVLGSSMFPSIRSGDVISVKPIEPEAISIGDVIFYQNADRFFAHRLVGKNRVNGDPLFITRGDHLPFCEPPISTSQVLGKVVMIQKQDMESCPRKLANYLIARASSSWFFRLWSIIDRFKRDLTGKI